MNYHHNRYPYPYRANPPKCNNCNKSRDYGPYPYTFNIHEAAKRNNNYRTTIWTGDYLQLTLMSIPVGGEIGLEVHYNLDQFLRLEEGCGVVLMGNHKNNLDFQEKISEDYSVFIPAGTWHNLINTGNKPIKLYSIYAPPEHPPGTIHKTKKESDADDHH